MSLVRTAYHEAGHAIVALGLGLPIGRVTIEATESLRGSVTLDLPDDPAPPMTRDEQAHVGIAELVWSLAGPLAESIAFGNADPGSYRDYREADSAVDRTDGVMGTLSWQWRGSVTVRVEGYLRENWHLVTRLALVLIGEPTMTGPQVCAIVGPVPPLDLTANLNGIRHWSGVMAARTGA